MGREKDQIGTLPLGLPEGFRCFDSKGLGGLIFGQNDAVAAAWITTHRHRQVA